MTADFVNNFGKAGRVFGYILAVAAIALPCEGFSPLTMSMTRPTMQPKRIVNIPVATEEFGVGHFFTVPTFPTSLILGAILTLSEPSIATASAVVVAADTHAPTSITASSVYTNSYNDPDHPFCSRRISVNRDSKTFTYTGQTAGPRTTKTETMKGIGCSPEEIREYRGSRTFVIHGRITDAGRIVSTDEGTGINLDGVWDSDGIQWNDGTKWTINEDSEESRPVQAGKAIFLAYVGFSLLAGAKAVFVDGWRPTLE